MSDEATFEARFKRELAQVRDTKESIKSVAKLALAKPDRLAASFHVIADLMPQIPIKERMGLLYVFDAICQRAKQARVDYTREAGEYAPPICLGVVHEDGVAHKLAGNYVKSVRKVLDVWKTKGVFESEMVDMLADEVKRGSDVLGEGTELMDPREAKRLQDEAELLRRKQKEEKLESQLRPVVGDAAAEFDELWALGGENMLAAGMPDVTKPVAPAAPAAPVPAPAPAVKVPAAKPVDKSRPVAEKKRERSRDRSPPRRADDKSGKPESAKKPKKKMASAGGKKHSGIVVLFELHDGLLPWQSLRNGSYADTLSRSDRRTRSELDGDGKWLWDTINKTLDAVAEEYLLYHSLRPAEPANVCQLDEHVRPRMGDYRRSDKETRPGEKGVIARFEHVMYVMQHLSKELSPARWDDVTRLRKDVNRFLGGALSKADALIREAEAMGARIVVAGEEGLISTLALCAVLGLPVDPRDVWSVKGHGRDELIARLRAWRHDGKRLVGLVRTPREYKGLLDELLSHPLLHKVTLDRVVDELTKNR